MKTWSSSVQIILIYDSEDSSQRLIYRLLKRFWSALTDRERIAVVVGKVELSTVWVFIRGMHHHISRVARGTKLRFFFTEARAEGLEEPGTGEGGPGCAGPVPTLQLTMCVLKNKQLKSRHTLVFSSQPGFSVIHLDFSLFSGYFQVSTVFRVCFYPTLYQFFAKVAGLIVVLLLTCLSYTKIVHAASPSSSS